MSGAPGYSETAPFRIFRDSRVSPSLPAKDTMHFHYSKTRKKMGTLRDFVC
jgi:hypothetical protein